jgi:hypothetical protein
MSYKTMNHELVPIVRGKSKWRSQIFFCSKGDGVVKNPVAAKEYGDIAADMLKQLKYIYMFLNPVLLIFMILLNTAKC